MLNKDTKARKHTRKQYEDLAGGVIEDNKAVMDKPNFIKSRPAMVAPDSLLRPNATVP
jgi:glycine cleavage system H lipoate-binding protein